MAESNNSERQGIRDCVQPGFESMWVRVTARLGLGLGLGFGLCLGLGLGLGIGLVNLIPS